MPKTRWTVEEREQIVKEYIEGMSLRDLAKKYQTVHMSIHRIVDRAGVMRDRSGLYSKVTPMMSVAEIVKTIREQMHWTQAELGERIGVGRSQICNIETGRHDIPASKLLALMHLAGWQVTPSKR